MGQILSLVVETGDAVSDAVSDRSFRNAVVLITGAGSGIGQSVAHQFASRGCQKLFLVDMSINGLEKTKSLIQDDGLGPKIELHQANITVEDSVREMVESCIRLFGRLDIAINNAGIAGSSTKTADQSVEEYDRVCNVNERGAFLCQKYEIQQMLSQSTLTSTVPRLGSQRGTIVNVASVAGHCIIPTAAHYVASKHSVVAMTRCDALKYSQSSIRINCVSPGAVWTPLVTEAGLPKAFLEMGAAQAPMKRYVEAGEVANAVVFLASAEKASAITGVNLSVDCGTQLLRTL